jgi:hypothetical protein
MRAAMHWYAVFIAQGISFSANCGRNVWWEHVPVGNRTLVVVSAVNYVTGSAGGVCG